MWLPFVLLQLCAAGVVVAYFRSSGFRAFCDRLGEMKEAGGLAFAAGAMALMAGVVPEVFKALSNADQKTARQRGRDTAFNCVLYAVNGLLANWFYVLMGLWFPVGTIGAMIAKVAIDMFVFTPFVGIPWMALMYTWREHRYRPLATVKSLGFAWYLSRVTPILLPCWAYWIPMCCLMYILPVQLTFVFGVTANAAAAVILITVASRKTEQKEQNAEGKMQHAEWNVLPVE